MKCLITIPQGKIFDTFIPPKVLKRLRSEFEVSINESRQQLNPSELAARLDDQDVCLTGWGTSRMTHEVLQRADKLRVVAHTGGTVADLCSDALYDRGIHLISGNPYYAKSVAEGTLTYMLAGLRRLPQFAQRVQEGGWSKDDSLTEALYEQTVGLIGFGAAARHLIPLLRPFEVTVLVYDPYVPDHVLEEFRVQRAPLEALLQQAKVISVHAAKTPETDNLLDERRLRLIMPGSLLINTSRGSLIDEKALARVLQEGRLRAVLDVFEEEPLPSNSQLRGLEHVILQPHLAGPTLDWRPKVTLALLEDMKRYFTGQPMELAISREQAARMTRH